MLLGFSTGCLYQTYPQISKETFAFFRLLGCNAIELMCHSEEDIFKLITEIAEADLFGFEYVSLHSPDVITVETLELLQRAQDIFHFQAIVINPSEIENWEIFSRFDLPISIENMDWKQERGKYVDSLQNIFEKIEAKMVLNINHCYTNDPSLLLAKQMTDEFGEKISQIHLSGFETGHESLFKTQQTEIMDAITNKNLPIIIESVCETVEDVESEFRYVKNYLFGK
ncbi:MAG: hypothetical protein HGA61_04725 [Candidatus Moranbacteria bacterium]|nr:hypothetical protein [Candidatus Moranbacteria bacterium]